MPLLLFLEIPRSFPISHQTIISSKNTKPYKLFFLHTIALFENNNNSGQIIIFKHRVAFNKKQFVLQLKVFISNYFPELIQSKANTSFGINSTSFFNYRV
jgi:hypothetical protein